MTELSEELDIRIEVDGENVIVILPRPMDDVAVPWQDAWQIGDVLEQAAGDLPLEKQICSPIQAEIQATQLGIRVHKNCVVLLFGHTDRIKLSYEAARIVARSIRMKAQDLDFASRGVHFSFKVPGRVGRITPCWEITKKQFNTGK